MTGIKAILLALALFSKIPMPRLDWTRKNMRFLLAAFPLVGLVIGLALRAWLWLADLLGFGPVLFAAGLVLLPLTITGGIHLDGFCDTVDALASHAEPEKKQKILQDPHAGAFAVIFVAAYLLAYLALGTELARRPESIWLLGLVQIMSRAAVGLGVLYFPAANSQGLLFTLQSSAPKKANTVFLLLIYFLAGTGLGWLLGPAGLVIFALPLLYGGHIYRMARKQFGGMSGDLAGYWLQAAELAMLAALLLLEKVVAL